MYAKCKSPKAVMSMHPPSHHLYQSFLRDSPESKAVPVLCRYVNESGFPRPKSFKLTDFASDQPPLAPFIGRGFLFGRSEFVREVPLDPYSDHCGAAEDLLCAARLWTSGWDIYAPTRNVVVHRDETGFQFGAATLEQGLASSALSARRALYVLARTMTLSSEDSALSELEQHAVLRRLNKYGLGTNRSLEEYLQLASIPWRIDPQTGPRFASEHMPEMSSWLCDQRDERGAFVGLAHAPSPPP